MSMFCTAQGLGRLEHTRIFVVSMCLCKVVPERLVTFCVGSDDKELELFPRTGREVIAVAEAHSRIPPALTFNGWLPSIVLRMISA
jgi:hypothetical protein